LKTSLLKRFFRQNHRGELSGHELEQCNAYGWQLTDELRAAAAAVGSGMRNVSEIQA